MRKGARSKVTNKFLVSNDGLHRTVTFGSEDGVKEACVFFTLCETCKQYGINFKEYITHVVKEIINGNTNYETLVPWAIKLA